jgi:hypothetical protein
MNTHDVLHEHLAELEPLLARVMDIMASRAADARRFRGHLPPGPERSYGDIARQAHGVWQRTADRLCDVRGRLAG